MPSSTSSSSQALLEAPWGRTWLLTAAVILASVGALELRLRRAGVRPTVEDTHALWSFHRDRADVASGAVVVVGSSRAQQAIDLRELEADGRVRATVELAINGGEAEPILEDLATGGLQRSTILCDLNPTMTFARIPKHRAAPLARLAYRARREAWRNWEVALQCWSRARLASLRPQLAPQGLPLLFRPSTWPAFRLFTQLPSGQVLADYSVANRSVQDARWATEVIETVAMLRSVGFERLARRLDGCVERLARRGNRVVFLRLPSSGATKRAEDALLPRARTWDRLAGMVHAPFVHFEDEPELRGFTCSEGSHLDEAAAREFTQGLIEVLERRGLLPE